MKLTLNLFLLIFISFQSFAVTIESNQTQQLDSLLKVSEKHVVNKKAHSTPKKPYNKLAVIGFGLSTLGIVSLLALLFAGIATTGSALLSLAGLVISIISLFKIKKRRERGKGLAITGIVFSILPYLFLLAIVLLWVGFS
ncbi:MAG: DUF4190 domain-containing protein [Cytophagaceae bacterium]|nr:DUF4190 domain-containing protein [Cytophagaceae bacterium]MBK9508726.1 DUF4190 domain-containing protein [Cytophagaceae bacterium]MBK9935629.1 DUF4190 domain-containing protein [Cytophagaceae bacterium]MBL0302071.1 DUF4190 domain-containing protein [Cytophagaceae bacterium]MBL0324893.1 DUF4190 domain-containing protein [Cytophagaceae bacterium]